MFRVPTQNDLTDAPFLNIQLKHVQFKCLFLARARVSGRGTHHVANTQDHL